MKRSPMRSELQAACSAFMSYHRVGDTILVRALPNSQGEVAERLTIAPPGAYVPGGYKAVVQGAGDRECVALTDVISGDFGGC